MLQTVGFVRGGILSTMFPQLFQKKSTESSQEQKGVSRTEMELLLARFDRLESELKGIRLEWNDVYDKVAHLYDRTRKRIQALQKAEDRSEGKNGDDVDQQVLAFQSHAEIMSYARNRGNVR